MEHCTKDYKFFEETWMSIIWFNIEGEDEIYAALSSQIFGSKKKTLSYLKALSSLLHEENKYVIRKVTLFKMKLSKKFKNKKGYWTKVPDEDKIEDGTYNDRISWLTPFLKSPAIYDVLVVVRGIFDGEITFDVARVFLKSDDQSRIEQFMYYSKQVVDPKSKHSGIYEVNKRLLIDWETKKEKVEKLAKLSEDDLID